MEYNLILCCILAVLLLIFIISFIKQKNKYEQEIDLIKEDKLEKIKLVYKEKEDQLKEEYGKKRQELQEGYQQRAQELYNNYNQQKNHYDSITADLDENFQKYKEKEEKKIKEDLNKYAEVERIKKQLEIDKKNTQLDKEYLERIYELKGNFEIERAELEIELEDIYDVNAEAALEYTETLEVLDDFRRRREVVNQQIIREKQIQEATDFYRICLSENDIEDLKIIKEIEHKFNNKEVLHKAAFDCYVRRPLSEMEKRVLGNKKPSGIYIITYVPTGEIYIGRSTDISNRWAEHVKSAFNLGTIAHSSLHTKMGEKGIWNFTFQVLEEVPKDKLNEREKYWINLYGATALLNQKQGG